MDGNDAFCVLRHLPINLGKVLWAWLGGAGMDWVTLQSLVKLLLSDIHPVAIDLVAKPHI